MFHSAWRKGAGREGDLPCVPGDTADVRYLASMELISLLEVVRASHVL